MQYTSILYVVKILNKVLNTIEKNKKYNLVITE